MSFLMSFTEECVVGGLNWIVAQCTTYTTFILAAEDVYATIFDPEHQFREVCKQENIANVSVSEYMFKKINNLPHFASRILGVMSFDKDYRNAPYL